MHRCAAGWHPVPATLWGDLRRPAIAQLRTDQKSSRVVPVVAVTYCSTTTRKRSPWLRLDSPAASCVIEGLCRSVLIEHPEMKRPIGLTSKQSLGRL